MLEFLRDKDFAELLAFWATTIGIFVGLLGAGLAYWTYRVNQKEQEWARARASYGSFIDTAIANPEFIPGYWSTSAQNDPEKMYKYLWFMAKFLWAAEEVLKSMLTEKEEWPHAIALVIREHADFFASSVGNFETQHYAPPLKALLSRTLATVEIPDASEVAVFTHAAAVTK